MFLLFCSICFMHCNFIDLGLFPFVHCNFIDILVVFEDGMCFVQMASRSKT